MGSGVLLGLSPSKFGHPNRALRRAELLIPLWRLSIDLARNVANGRAQVFVNSQVNDALRRHAASFCKDSGVAATNDQTGILYQESAFDPTPNMKTPVDLFRRGYELLVSGANVLQSSFLLLLRIYFFWQLFQTGQGKLAHIEKISDYFASLGIPLPTLNAYMAGATETFGSVLLIIGLASRLTAIPITVVMAVAYLTADLEAVTGIFSDPDKFVKADPFPFLVSALIVLVFGPGKFSIDSLIKWLDASRRNIPKRSLRFGAPVTPTEAKAQH